MQSSGIPPKFTIPFANSAGAGYIRTVPNTSQIGVHDGWASFTDGFPPLNFNPVASGGVPPFGQDMNGILKASTSWDQWFQLGGPVAWDSAFSSAVSGYPKGAQVQSSVTFGARWLSTVENNTSNPDMGGAGWTPVYGYISTISIITAGIITAPVGATIGRVRAVGGGGGGGSLNGASASGYFSAAAGGGSGSYAEVIFPASTLSGLTATPGVGGTYGNAGGATTIGGVLSVPGGMGSAAIPAYNFPSVGTPAASAGPPTTTGTVVELRQGAPGLLGIAQSTGNTVGGAGGNSRLGAGGGYSGGTNGVAAGGPGGGGGGASINSASAQTFGGTGGNGEILIDWFS
jgi:hypothetical protein